MWKASIAFDHGTGTIRRIYTYLVAAEFFGVVEHLQEWRYWRVARELMLLDDKVGEVMSALPPAW